MDFELGPRATAGGFRLLSFETIGSTNDTALDRARSGDPGGLWVAAHAQTSGRGRRGRNWATPHGNLGASVLTILPAASARHAATLGFVAGLALRDALGWLAGDGGARFFLKWPNDVMVDGAKLAGILLDSERLPDGRIAVVTGIGVNVAETPSGLAYAATSLAELAIATSAHAVFAALTDAWVDRATTWAGGVGLPDIRRSWLAGAAGLGGPVAVTVGTRTVNGFFETIDDDGRLVVRTPEGVLETIAAADVQFGPAASVGAG